tara:strand:+ start:96 stop:242 length:147 start_codon:yes stop_codon:yes gene_type:complete
MAKKCKSDAIWSEKRKKCISLISLAKETKTWKRFGGDKLENKIKKASK